MPTNVKYPQGVIPPSSKYVTTKTKHHHTTHTNNQPVMMNYTVKPVKHKRHRRHKRHSKYNAHRVYYDHHWFDSETECGFYIYLRYIHAVFRLHVRYIIKPHHVTPNGIHIRQRNYTPDFVRYKSLADLKANKPYEVDDVKGIGSIPSYDSMRFGAFEDKFDIPVVIIRWKHNHWTREHKCF